MPEIPARVKDKTGARYGRLIVTGFSHTTPAGAYFHCVCDCGGEKTVAASSLSKGITRSCGCLVSGADGYQPKNTRDETGNRYGKLTVLRYAGSANKGGSSWLCRCDCGNEKVITAHAFRRGHTTSCGCYVAERQRPNELPGSQAVWNTLIRTYKRHAKKRGHEWSITDEQAEAMFTAPCHYCGDTGSNQLTGKRGEAVRYNGIDRAHNELGYTEWNTVPCCKRCNSAKSDTNNDEFLAWVLRVAEYSKLYA